ncbi:MAG: DNA primase [Lentisphaeria bacterium]|nr:DNA primase [Lentisphaeria bacterium]
MAGFDQDIIEEIRSRCDIAEVIGNYVQLKRRGSTAYTGLCPFHQEKTPSFHVDGKWQRYHCFGCGKDGDVFRFIMDHDNIAFPDAVRQLAQRCGVILPESSDYDPGSSRANRDLRERLYKVNEEFSNFFVRFLRDNPGSPAGRYLEGRGIDRAVADKFKIGAVPDDRYACLNYGRHLGFSEEDLVAAGICGRAEGSGRFYERFTGRLTFAIENEYGRGVGFSARSLEPKPADGRKYVNTPETAIFKKGMLLYALPQARESVSRDRKMILCEGQMDTIAMHRAGFTNAVAPLGTAFTPEQAKLVKRYADEVSLAFDSDGAGQKAFLRAAEYILPLSLSMRMIRIPGGKDPDELYSHGGREAVAAAVNASVPWLEQFNLMLPGLYDMSTPVGRGQAAGFMVSLFSLVNNQIELESYIREGAALLNVSEDALYAELNRQRNRSRRVADMRQPEPEKSTPVPIQSSPERSALLTLFALAISSEDTARNIGELLPPGSGDESSVVWKALNLLLSTALNGEKIEDAVPGINELLAAEPDPELGQLLISTPEFADPVRAVDDSVNEFMRISRRRRYAAVAAELRNCADPEKRFELMKQLQEVMKEK